MEIRVPTLGESLVEATVGQWRKREGDQVNAGDTLVELETDKVNMDVTATGSGVLQAIHKQAGETVGIGEVLGIVGDGATVTAAPASTPVTAASGAQPAPDDSVTGDNSRSTPLARRIAAEHSIDLGQVKGTGPGGRVSKDDIAAYIGQPSAAPPPVSPTPVAATPSPTPVPSSELRALSSDSGRGEERVRMSRRRQTIARRLVEAQHTAAMLTTFNEVDMSAIMDVRKRRRDAFKERHGVSLGFMSFFTKAAIGALKAYPRLNAEIQGDEMVLKHYYDIGIAVGADEGLVVPVVRDADRLSFAAIEQQIADLAGKARKNTLGLADLQGGTFTITNGGVFGSLLSTPILNGPQVAILGLHKIEERPIALNGQVVIRPMMYLALSYDHRIVDGSEAVRFLVRIKELIEDPESLLLEG